MARGIFYSVGFMVCVVLAFFVLFPPGFGIQPRPPEATTESRLRTMQVACESYKAEYGPDRITEPAKMLRLLQGATFDGYNPLQKVFVELTRSKKTFFFEKPHTELNARGELIDGWGNPFVWEYDARVGHLALWSQMKDRKADRETAIKHGLYAVLFEGSPPTP